MQPQELLAVVLPTAGHYCTAELSTKRRQHIYVPDIEHLEEAIVSFNKQSKNTYFALASFTEAGSRTAANARYMRAFFFDIDVGKGEKTYASKREAVAALLEFMAVTKLDTLGTPWLVDSGGGVHAHLPYDRDTTIEEWRPIADAIKQAASAHGFRMDMTVTADAARVLRPPGTLNFNYDPPRPVVLKQRGTIFSFAAIAALVGALVAPVAASAQELVLPGKRPAPLTESVVMQALQNNSATYFKKIWDRTKDGNGCGQLLYYAQHATEDGMEPIWRGLLSIAIKCDDGRQAAVKLSKMHPYDFDRMQRKIAEIKGPYACAKLDGENPGICGKCPHWGNITNPLALGREIKTREAQDVAQDAPDIASHINYPTLPRGYSYGEHGGIYGTRTNKDGSKDQIQLLPYVFVMVDSMREGAVHRTRFVAVRKDSIIYVTVPSEAVGKKETVIRILAGQNIIACHGANNDQNLYDYVRACVGEASATGATLTVPPNMGWQPGGGFALGDRVILPGDQSYTFVSDNLNNVIHATTPRGELGEWQRIMHMLQLKELWGPLFFAGIGFGSALMAWGGDDTPGMTYHACGNTSGAGKSLALALCAAVWGSPAHYPIKPQTSDTTMYQRAGLLGSLPLTIDEVTTKSRESKNEWMPKWSFGYSQGGHKTKGSASANAELDNSMYWKAFCVLTSNDPQLEIMMGARDATSEGEAKRLLEWETRAKIRWTEAERDLLELLKTNYGTAGPKFIEWCVNNQEKAKEVQQATKTKWRKMMLAEDDERFWTNGNSTVIAALTLCGPKYANIFPFDVAQLAKFAMAMVEQARGTIAANQRTAMDILNAYTRDYHGQFVKQSPDSVQVMFGDGRLVSKDSTKSRIAGRVEVDVRKDYTDYYIEVGVMKRYCAQMNWSYNAFVSELRNTPKMVVDAVRKNLLSGTQGPEMRVNCLWVAKLTADVSA